MKFKSTKPKVPTKMTKALKPVKAKMPSVKQAKTMPMGKLSQKLGAPAQGGY